MELLFISIGIGIALFSAMLWLVVFSFIKVRYLLNHTKENGRYMDDVLREIYKTINNTEESFASRSLSRDREIHETLNSSIREVYTELGHLSNRINAIEHSRKDQTLFS